VGLKNVNETLTGKIRRGLTLHTDWVWSPSQFTVATRIMTSLAVATVIGSWPDATYMENSNTNNSCMIQYADIHNIGSTEGTHQRMSKACKTR